MSRRPPSTDSPGGLLSAVRTEDTRVRAAELGKAYAVLAWLDAHPADSVHAAAGRAEDSGATLHGERALLLGGAGCPLVAEFCLAELATTLGVGDATVRSLASDLLELRHRLPRTWSRVEALDLPLWRARRIAARTAALDGARAEGADRQLVSTAHRLSVARVDAFVTALLHDQLRDSDVGPAPSIDGCRAGRHVRVDLPVTPHAPTEQALAGLAFVEGTLDLLDAADLEKSLRIISTQLRSTRPDTSIDELRAEALGVLARGELLLPVADDDSMSTATHTDPETGEVARLAPTADRTGRTRAARELVLHVHLSAAALTGAGDTRTGGGLARVESGPARLVDVDTVRAWVATALTEDGTDRFDTSRVTVRPVLDLAEEQQSGGHAASPRLREQVVVRDGTCVFPGCDRPGRRSDLDHIEPWQPPDPDDPVLQTTTDNLAVLCRQHHRLKTHSRWRYRRVGPPVEATYDWTSPTGQIIRRLPDGSTHHGAPAPF